MAHELGHQINAKHSSVDDDNNGHEDDEYGDNSDLMGFQKYWRGMNAPHRVLLGWMPEQAIAEMTPKEDCSNKQSRIVTLTSLASLERPTAQHPGVVTLPRSSKLNEDAGQGRYYVSFRAATNLDKSFTEQANRGFKRNQATGKMEIEDPMHDYMNKAFVHYTFNNEDIQNTELVQTLAVGDVFEDKVSKVRVTFLGWSGAQGQVKVDLCGGAPITTTTPATPAARVAITTTAPAPAANCDGTAKSHFGIPIANTRPDSTLLIATKTAANVDACANICLTSAVECGGAAFTGTGQGTCRIYKAGEYVMTSVAASKKIVFVERHAACANVAVVEVETMPDADIPGERTPAGPAAANCGNDVLSHFAAPVQNKKGRALLKFLGKRVHKKSTTDECAAICKEAGTQCMAFSLAKNRACRLYKTSLKPRSVKEKMGFAFYTKLDECARTASN